MKAIQRDQYTFIGRNVQASAEYYDIIISHGYNGNMLYLAWDAAHKFGNRMISKDVASFRDGVAIGQNAFSAAEFTDIEQIKAYSSGEKYGRKKRMKDFMTRIYAEAERRYDVELKLF